VTTSQKLAPPTAGFVAAHTTAAIGRPTTTDR